MILFGVKSAALNECKRQAVMETWGSTVPESMLFRFVIGAKDLTIPAQAPSNWFLADCPDTYWELPKKLAIFCGTSLQRRDWNFIFSCDDDTFVHVPRLVEFAKGLSEAGFQGLYGSTPQPSETRNVLHGGGGYLISRQAAALIADELINLTGADDLIASMVVEEAGLPVIQDARFCYNFAWGREGQVSCHWISIKRMRRLFQRIQNEGM
jgi:hypothetical protein